MKILCHGTSAVVYGVKHSDWATLIESVCMMHDSVRVCGDYSHAQ